MVKVSSKLAKNCGNESLWQTDTYTQTDSQTDRQTFIYLRLPKNFIFIRGNYKNKSILMTPKLSRRAPCMGYDETILVICFYRNTVPLFAVNSFRNFRYFRYFKGQSCNVGPKYCHIRNQRFQSNINQRFAFWFSQFFVSTVFCCFGGHFGWKIWT